MCLSIKRKLQCGWLTVPVECGLTTYRAAAQMKITDKTKKH